MAKRKTSFLENLVTVFIGSVATKIISFLLVPLYTAVLSTDEFGSVDIALTTGSLLLPLFTGVIFEAVLRFSLDDTKDKNQVFTIAIIIDVVGILVFLALSPVILLYPPLSKYYIYFVLYFISLVINDTVLYFARGLNKLKKYTIASVIQTIVLCLLNVFFLVVIKAGVRGYFLAYILSSACSTLAIWVLIRMDRFLTSPRNIDKNLCKEMLRYSVPMIPNTISWWISSSSDRYFIIAMCSVAANGIYAVASKIPTLISLGTSIFNTAWQISAVEDYGTDASRKRFSKMCFDYYSIIFVLGTGVILVTKILAKFLFRQDFFNAWVYVPILVVSACFHAFSTFVGSVFTTTKNTKYMSITTLIGAFLNIIMNYYFIRYSGPIGAAVATLASYIVVYLLRYFFAQRIYTFEVNIKNDIICCTLLIAQMVIVCTQFFYTYILSSLIFIIVLVLRFKSMKEMAKLSINTITRKFKQEVI